MILDCSRPQAAFVGGEETWLERSGEFRNRVEGVVWRSEKVREGTPG